MRKWIKVIIIFFMIITAMVLYSYNQKTKEKNEVRVSGDIGKIIQIQIIDKKNSMEKIHENYKDEKYQVVDIIIDGNYYCNVGIRTKGSAIYTYLKQNDSKRHSYKVKLDYSVKDQKYKGMTEVLLNTNVMDNTGYREYIAYKVFNDMGVATRDL